MNYDILNINDAWKNIDILLVILGHLKNICNLSLHIHDINP
jgi:hypothetical protein